MSSIRQLSEARIAQLETLLQAMQMSCERLDLLDESLTHSSFAKESQDLDFERLEFFGDAVLKFVVSEYLFLAFKELDEGELTEIRAVIVSAKILEQVGKKFELQKFVKVGRGVTVRASIIARSMEAILGAIYLDSNFDQIRPFIVEHFCAQALDISRDSVKENYKAQLQQLTQARAQGTPSYSVIEVEGPPHDPVFTVAVLVENRIVADAKGRSKKAAEQAAARAAVDKLNEVSA